MSKNTKILHLETSTEICSVAISDEHKLLAESSSNKGFEHSSKGTLFVEACLAKANLRMEDLAAVSISEGPGSYTGLRVGFAMAKGFCYAHDLALICIPTLKALADGVDVTDERTVISSLLDARRMEVYTASYDIHLEERSALKALVLDEQTYLNHYGVNDVNLFIGDGAHKVRPWLREGQDRILDKFCNAADQMKLAHKMYREKAISDIAYSVPAYLKSPNITVSKKNLLS